MIGIEGRLIPGLDEFMLRLGHLKVLCNVSAEVDGSLTRIERETAAVLTKPIVIQPDDNLVIEYLKSKNL